jgi:uncharacterized protein YuzE
MRLMIDREADSLLLILREGSWKRTEQANKYVNLELGHDDELMAVEVLNLSQHAGRSVLDHLDLNFAPELEPLEVQAE